MAVFLRTLVIATAAVAMFANVAMGENYNVGAPNGGWDLNTSLQAWANNITFMVGDTLTFQYGPTHSVLEVKLTDYTACLTNDSISSDASGHTVISLTSIGNRYLICGTPTHCDRGMKVAITTVAAPAPPPGTPSVPPAATPSSPAPAKTPSPATPSGSPTASPVSSPVASPAPKTAAPTSTPKISPSVSPSKSPASSPSKSPAKSPGASPPTPESPTSTPSLSTPAESPANPPPSPPSPSSANTVSVVTGFTTGMGIIMMMLTL